MNAQEYIDKLKKMIVERKGADPHFFPTVGQDVEMLIEMLVDCGVLK